MSSVDSLTVWVTINIFNVSVGGVGKFAQSKKCRSAEIQTFASLFGGSVTAREPIKCRICLRIRFRLEQGLSVPEKRFSLTWILRVLIDYSLPVYSNLLYTA